MDGNRMILRALKGAPVSVVLALMVAPRAMGVTELEGWTGYSDKPVKKALELLARLGYVQRHSHRHGWMLTAHGRQMVLGEGPNPEILRIQPGSSGSSSLIEEQSVLPETTTTTTPKPENLRVRPPDPWAGVGREWVDVAKDVLMGHCGISRAGALAIVAEVSRAGWFPGQLGHQALRWLAYTQDDERSTINNAPAFISSRLLGGTRPPSGYQPASWFKQWGKVTGYKQQWDREIAAHYGRGVEF